MCVNVIVLGSVFRWGHQKIPYGELWAARLGWFHFPKQLNLSQRSKCWKIRADSYRSISFKRTCRLQRGEGDCSTGEGHGPICWLWRSSDLSKRLRYLFTHALNMTMTESSIKRQKSKKEYKAMLQELDKGHMGPIH